MTTTSLSAQSLTVAPGDTVTVRDEEWMVTGVEAAADGTLIHVRGLSELVRDTTAKFYDALDEIVPFDPRDVSVVGDDTPRYRRTRVQLEALLRKAPVPLQDEKLYTSAYMLADDLSYQHRAVAKALDPQGIRPRLLIADAVGLGKTIEIGMILSELVARGRGERILIVTPRSVLEQMQAELWNRFALPFVRLDSTGIQWIRRHLPASRNPFSYFSRAIISVDTLKSDRFRPQLENVSWDAVVIDESHNLTNTATQNNELARVLAPRTESLILASATPHNGRNESFAELLRLLDPTAVRPDGSFSDEDVQRLVIRRHRHSPEVASVVGADWAERGEPENMLVDPSPEEDAVAEELATRWLHPRTGTSPYSGSGSRLFPWTLAKSFLSSPAALEESLAGRLHRITGDRDPATVQADRTEPGSSEAEVAALQTLRRLNNASLAAESSAKFLRLIDYLQQIGVGRSSPTRAVVFAERLATLHWLQRDLPKRLGLKPENIEMLHGGLSDVEQQEIIESFKLEDSPIRVLVAGDMASEGVNLHAQCHHLVHYDIPWSLIRIEQRNGRIDRYGQKHRPQVASLALRPSHEDFSGDLRILSKLVTRADHANRTLGGVAGVMGTYSVSQEEGEIEKVLAGRRPLDDVLATDTEVREQDPLAALGFDDFFDDGASTDAVRADDTSDPAPGPETLPALPEIAPRHGLFTGDADFLDAAVHLAFVEPSAPLVRNGVAWSRERDNPIVELSPPRDLRARLQVLPQSYLSDRKVTERLRLATSTAIGHAELTAARRGQDSSSWPRAHFLSPLHPVLDWAADRALAVVDRREVPVVRGASDMPAVLFLGTLLNERGQVVTRAFLSALFLAPLPDAQGELSPPLVQPIDDLAEQFADWGLNGAAANPGPVADAGFFTPHVRQAFPVVSEHLQQTNQVAQHRYEEQLAAFLERFEAWEHGPALPLLRSVQEQKARVDREKQVARSLRPAQWSLRALLVVEPIDGVEGRN